MQYNGGIIFQNIVIVNAIADARRCCIIFTVQFWVEMPILYNHPMVEEEAGWPGGRVCTHLAERQHGSEQLLPEEGEPDERHHVLTQAGARRRRHVAVVMQVNQVGGHLKTVAQFRHLKRKPHKITAAEYHLDRQLPTRNSRANLHSHNNCFGDYSLGISITFTFPLL